MIQINTSMFFLLFQYHKYSFECGQHKGKVHPKQTLRSTPNLVPNLMFRTAYGAWLMLSEPPHRTTSDSLRQISYKHTNNVWMIKFHSLIHHKRIYIPESIALLCNGRCFKNNACKTQLNWFIRLTISILPNFFSFWWSTDLSAIDDGLETRSTQPVDSKSRHWNGNTAPQTHMTGNVGCISWALMLWWQKKIRNHGKTSILPNAYIIIK